MSSALSSSALRVCSDRLDRQLRLEFWIGSMNRSCASSYQVAPSRTSGLIRWRTGRASSTARLGMPSV